MLNNLFFQYDGTYLGTLRQSWNGGTWSFPVGDSKRQAEGKKLVQNVLADIKISNQKRMAEGCSFVFHFIYFVLASKLMRQPFSGAHNAAQYRSETPRDAPTSPLSKEDRPPTASSEEKVVFLLLMP